MIMMSLPQCYYHTDYIIWQLYKKAPTWAPGSSSSLDFGGEGHQLPVPAILVSCMEQDY